MKKRYIIIPSIVILICLMISVADTYLYILPRGKYTNEHFGITTYVSGADRDGDGVDDQSDIYQSVLNYLQTKPKYKSKYYIGGYPTDNYGVCTDVVAFGLKGAGYDLRQLVDADIAASPESYTTIDEADSNIDFRRVRNLEVYFSRHAIALSTDLSDVEVWQAGDIVTFSSHIAVISANRDKKGIPYILHLASPVQVTYEAPLTAYKDGIVSHYRIS